MLINKLLNLKKKLVGELLIDNLHKAIYATDASVYRILPLAVAYPKGENDLVLLIKFANKNKITLIPRTAGTSLAGQCVGDGIVVDVSKYFTKIISFNENLQTITVQPGVIRDELNIFLKPYGLFFGPNTSTSNRCMIGGMVGNNSSGTTSIQFGVTRDKVTQLKTILSDGSKAVFKSVSTRIFKEKALGNTLENSIYKVLLDQLSNPEIQTEIKREFPKPSIHRRNNGYAIDSLLNFELFGGKNNYINIAKLLCGSEGTLAFTTEITLKLDKLAPTHSILVASHFHSIEESLKAVQIAMKHQLFMCELMDKAILDCTKNNREQVKNRFFIQGDPKAVLMLEVSANTVEKTTKLANKLIADLVSNNLGYTHIKVQNKEINKVINLRKAGLGLLGNIVGDKKAVACIEDTAVSIDHLPNYITEFTQLMQSYQQDAIYYAHAGAGEIHLRPILNLKKQNDVILFKKITKDVARLVKKYKGSFSGEHGDGIVRSEFIIDLIGKKNYHLLEQIKNTFDPNNIFNKGKIIYPYKMDKNLRYKPERKEPIIDTLLNFDDNQGILRLAEKCNGSGDCRKPISAGGVMCPSYRATKNEKDTTRARANALREFLTNSDKINKFDYQELKEVFDLCLSCKACASECPSNVDVASLKAEFLHQYYKSNSPNFRTKLFANNNSYVQFARFTPTIANFILNLSITKQFIGISKKRTIPKISNKSFFNYLKTKNTQFLGIQNNKMLYLFVDEFTNIYDVQLGKDTYNLLTKLGYQIYTIKNAESGRAAISKGFLENAKKFANKNIELYKDLINKNTPLVGIEPSAILGFRDEYLRLAIDIDAAQKIANNTFTIEEFISNEINKGNIKANQFTKAKKIIKIHTHCHQKSLSNSKATFDMLNLPTNYQVSIFNSGCCGMAGSFGYEKEHYEISMEIGENGIFKKIRNTNVTDEIAVSGTSCRHQIKDGTQRDTLHPVQILLKAIL